MMKVGIITIFDNENCGNRLQNYALEQFCNKKLNIKTYTLKNESRFNNRGKYIITKQIVNKMINPIKTTIKRVIKYHYCSEKINHYRKFNRNLNLQYKEINAFSKLNEFDFLIIGSDQVWNPTFGRLSDIEVLKDINPQKRISYAASFGINNLDEDSKNKVKNEISKFKSISVREDRGKEIVEELTGRKDVEVLVDPTMLLTAEEWDKVSNRPKQLDNIKEDKYILNYFLGELSESRRKEIERVAKENNCHIINILDKNDPFYTCGPSEFLYLEKHAFLICTDSFHSSVFAILYNRPFIIFDREQKGMNNMNSRLETLLNKFKLIDRKYNEINITKENLEHNYTEAYKILEKERLKSKEFLKQALNIK